jgi:hypothetical protein
MEWDYRRFLGSRFRLLRHRPLTCALLTLLVLHGLAGCSGSAAPQMRSDGSDHRILGISANPRPVPSPAPQDVANAIALVAGAGARGAVETFTWSTLETSPGVYSLQNLQNHIASSSSQGFTIYVGIQVINTIPKETPTDLLGVAWSDLTMKSRFHALLDAIRPLLTSQVQYLSIGNEVNVYLTSHPTEWAQYQNFYEDALAYVHQTMPGIQVGVTTTFTGASGAAQANVLQLNTMSDVWIFTYYPLGAGFVPKGPQSLGNDFATMLTLAGGRAVVLQEVGYPTSSVLSSSEADQAAFVKNVFQVWQARSQQIPFLSYFALHDFTSDFCASLAQYYGDPNNSAFEAYLCSLGLRHSDGTPKPSWGTLVSAAAAQGFPH